MRTIYCKYSTNSFTRVSMFVLVVIYIYIYVYVFKYLNKSEVYYNALLLHWESSYDVFTVDYNGWDDWVCFCIICDQLYWDVHM